MFFAISAFFFLCFAFHLLYIPEAHASNNTKEFKPLRNTIVLMKNKVSTKLTTFLYSLLVQ